MIEKIRLGNIMVDCYDAQELCGFYHKLLGWEERVLFGLPALCSENGIIFLFIGEEDYTPPIWPEAKSEQQKQMHFDFQVPDVALAVEYAQSLGAKKAAVQYGGDDFVTMIDPAGHPFCLCYNDNPA